MQQAAERWAESLAGDHIDAIRAWQGLDHHYRDIQRVLRGMPPERAVPGVVEEIALLSEAIDSFRLPTDVEAYRGIRSAHNTFGPLWPDRLAGEWIELSGFVSVTLDRAQTVAFTNPEGPGGGAFMVLSIPEGTAGAPIFAAGEPALAAQRELLLADGVPIVVGRVDLEATPPIIYAEVV